MPARLLGTTALAGAAAWCLPGPAPHAPSLCRALGIERRLPGDGVALTFDDGPHPEGTPAVLRALEAAGARATFFLVGEQVERDPGLAAEIAAAGHAIALHGHRHRNLLLVPPRALAADLDRAVDVIAAATGHVPAVYRPPFGVFSAAALALARRRGWTPLLWSRWGRDWRRTATAEGIAAEVAGEAGPGDVLLLHDSDAYSAPGSWRRTAGAVPRVLDALGRRALDLVTI